MPTDLTIVVPTCNRAEHLRQCLYAIASGVRCDYDVIVVDGASTDHTPEILSEAARYMGHRLSVVHEERREGFVRGANKGFRAATGRNLCWVNDDARPLPGALDRAVEQVDRADQQLGFVALFHRWHSTWNVAYETRVNNTAFRLCHVRGTLYANFPLGRTDTWRQLGFLDERFYFLGADPDLSLKAWHAGLRIEPAWGCCLDHEEHDDDRRAADNPRGKADNVALFSKWDLPDRNPWRNDFNPARPCTLRGLRGGRAIAA
jgi:GT2 family glycosyltransferase